MSARTWSREVEGLLPGGGPSVRLPDAIADAWAEMETQRESPSSVVAFLECPLKWFVERHLPALHEKTGETILNLESFPKSPPTKFTVGGTLTHRALETFYSEPPAHRTKELLEEVFEDAWYCLDKGDERTGAVSRSHIREYNQMLSLERGDLKAFKRQFRRTYLDYTMAILDMENPQTVDVVSNEGSVQTRVGRMSLFGKIDRVDRTLRGDLIVVDYKTGKTPQGDASVFNPPYLPCGIYAKATIEAESAKPTGSDVAGARLLYLQGLERVQIAAKPSNIDAVNEVLDAVATTTEAIGETGRVVTNPGNSANERPCRYCPLRDVCPAWN